MSEHIEIYKLRKLIYQIMFNFYENDYQDEVGMFDLFVLNSLKNIVKVHVSNNELSKDVIYNINKFLSQARDYEDENREKRINIINDIITTMNKQQYDNSLIFYRLQLYRRRKEFKYLFKLSDNDIRNEIENVHDSICHDLFLLISHTNEVSDTEFVDEYLPSLQNSRLYYESLNVILRENPIVFKNRTFYNRVMCVLSMNNEIGQDVVELNKKFVKKIIKEIKKV